VTPDAPAGLAQRCRQPTALRADGGPAPSPVPPPRGLCWALATPGRPTWHALLPGQGVFRALRSRAARRVVLAGVGRPLLTACTEGKGQRRITALRGILAAQALCGLGSAPRPGRHGWGQAGTGPPCCQAGRQPPDKAQTERGRLRLPTAGNHRELKPSAASTSCRVSRSPGGGRGVPVPQAPVAAGGGISAGQWLGKHRRARATVLQGTGPTRVNERSLTHEAPAGDSLVSAAHAAIACKGSRQAAAPQSGPCPHPARQFSSRAALLRDRPRPHVPAQRGCCDPEPGRVGAGRVLSPRASPPGSSAGPPAPRGWQSSTRPAPQGLSRRFPAASGSWPAHARRR